MFPWLYEGLAGAVIEAMALGLSILASDIHAMREVLDPDGNAVLVKPGGAAALADAVATLLADRAQMTSIAERSRHRFLEKFTLDRAVDRMVDLYEYVAGARG